MRLERVTLSPQRLSASYSLLVMLAARVAISVGLAPTMVLSE